ncbi:MAG: RNA 2',3'-cyclic phosphodiesterase [Anaerolineae bacterium]|nr:RNA 2',3'-cyclic phosphodiesterase [Anaerolineae bacterium]
MEPKKPAAKTVTIRAFIAIELNEAVQVALREVQERLKKAVPRGSVRWVQPEGVHLTLKFLGNIPAAQVPEIAEALLRAGANVAPFTLTVEGRGCFPDSRRPNVIWVAVTEKTGALARLQRAIEAEISPLGYPPEGRAFRPHLTLGRTNRDAGSDRLRQVGAAVEATVVEVLGTVEVRSLSLIRSELRPGGAVYTRLAEAPLGGA